MDVLVIQAEAVQYDLPVPQAGEDGPAQGLRLLHDLLEHEVLIAALFRCGDLPVHMGALLLHRLEQGVVYLDRAGGEHGHLSVIQIAYLPGMLDDGSDVRGQQVEALSISQHQGGVLSHRHQLIRLVGTYDPKGVRPLDAVEHLGDRVQQVAVVVILQQLGHHLGVCLRGEGHPLGLQKLLQLGVVFDDPVVDHGDPPGLAHLGVGVHVVGRAVGSPAGMSHAHGAGDQRASVGQVVQNLEAALGLYDLEPLLLVIDRQSGGVVSPVLQTG